MPFDFDRVLDRRGTASLKWDTGPAADSPRGVLPAWVADMDFPAPEAVREAVRARAEHGVFGYTVRTAGYERAVVDWMARRFRWAIEPGWIVSVPGVVPAVSLAVQAFSEPGDRVVIQSPVYHPFSQAIEQNGREVVHNLLVEERLRYRMDLDHLARAFEAGARLLILCSPHNPVGRVWGRDELEALAAECIRHDVVVVSDEIHQDLVMPGRSHVPLASLGPEMAALTVTATAPNKTFNIAGLQAGTVIISNQERRRQFRAAMSRVGLGLPGLFAVVASEAAYTHGEPWLEALLEYLHGNAAFVRDSLARRLPEVSAAPLEGTYLMWLDCRRLGLDDETIERRLLDAGVWLDAGRRFGPGGEGFQRLNIGCPRATLDEGVNRIVSALAAAPRP